MQTENREYFVCRPEELTYLKKKDKKLGALIDLAGPIKREVRPDPFQGLVHAIIGQQISSAAQQTIWSRFLSGFFPLTPHNLLQFEPEALKEKGVSLRKAGYILGIAREFASGAMDDLSALTDEEICVRLSALKGVGKWTAEMLLIFTFQRRDVLSLDDLAIQRGLRLLYGKKELTPAFLKLIKKRYHPCATAASLYLWELAGGKYRLDQA